MEKIMRIEKGERFYLLTQYCYGILGTDKTIWIKEPTYKNGEWSLGEVKLSNNENSPFDEEDCLEHLDYIELERTPLTWHEFYALSDWYKQYKALQTLYHMAKVGNAGSSNKVNNTAINEVLGEGLQNKILDMLLPKVMDEFIKILTPANVEFVSCKDRIVHV